MRPSSEQHPRRRRWRRWPSERANVRDRGRRRRRRRRRLGRTRFILVGSSPRQAAPRLKHRTHAVFSIAA